MSGHDDVPPTSTMHIIDVGDLRIHRVATYQRRHRGHPNLYVHEGTLQANCSGFPAPLDIATWRR
jgi:hypothetical protein